MSKIRKELEKVTEVSIKRGESDDDYRRRLAHEGGKLPDDDWDKLSEGAQDWLNSVADAINAKKDKVPDFPDAEKAEEEQPTRRRRQRADEDEVPASKKYEPKVGDRVNVTTKSGKNYDDAEVIEIDAKEDLIVIDNGKAELEITISTSTIMPAGGDDAGGDEPEKDDGPPAVGDTVQYTTKRGKTIMGVVVEMDKEVIVVKDPAGDEIEQALDRIEEIQVKVRAAGTKGRSDEPASGGRRRSSSKEEPEGRGGKEEPEKGRRVRSADGVSIGTRIKELILDNLDASKDDIMKMLKKEGVEFRENTVQLNYAETHKLLDLLKSRKMLKA